MTTENNQQSVPDNGGVSSAEVSATTTSPPPASGDTFTSVVPESLLGSVEGAVQAQASENLAKAPEPTVDPGEISEWYLTEKVKGEGQRPEFLLKKFANVSAQAQAYIQLEEQFGAHKGAPESYNLDFLKELGVPLDTNTPQLQEFMVDAKTANVNQDFFQKALTKYVQFEQSKIPDPVKEREKLGPNSAEDLNTLKQWALNELDVSQAEDLFSWLTTASRVDIMQKRRASMQPTAIPTDPNLVPLQQQAESVADLKQEMADNYDKYRSNEKYAADVSRRLAVAIKLEKTESLY